MLTPEEALFLGKIRKHLYRLYLLGASYQHAGAHYLSLDRYLKVLGAATSLSFLWVRFVALKAGLPLLDSIFSAIGTLTSLFFLWMGYCALVYRWADKVKTYPVLANQAHNTYELYSQLTEAESPSLEHPLCKQADASRRQFESDKRNFEEIPSAAVLKAFRDLCRHYPDELIRCDVCGCKRSVSDFAYKKWKLLKKNCSQCGLELSATRPAAESAPIEPQS